MYRIHKVAFLILQDEKSKSKEESIREQDFLISRTCQLDAFHYVARACRWFALIARLESKIVCVS